MATLPVPSPRLVPGKGSPSLFSSRRPRQGPQRPPWGWVQRAERLPPGQTRSALRRQLLRAPAPSARACSARIRRGTGGAEAERSQIDFSPAGLWRQQGREVLLACRAWSWEAACGRGRQARGEGTLAAFVLSWPARLPCAWRTACQGRGLLKGLLITAIHTLRKMNT